MTEDRTNVDNIDAFAIRWHVLLLKNDPSVYVCVKER